MSYTLPVQPTMVVKIGRLRARCKWLALDTRQCGIGRTMPTAHRAFHRIVEALERVAASDGQVFDGRLLAWAQMIGVRLGPVTWLGHADGV